MNEQFLDVINNEINDHRRCICFLEILFYYLEFVYIKNPKYSSLAYKYLKEIIENRNTYPNCREQVRNWRFDKKDTYFDRTDLLEFCSNIKNVKIVNLMNQIEPMETENMFTTQKIKETEAMLRESSKNAKLLLDRSLAMLGSIKIEHRNFYKYKDIRWLLFNQVYNSFELKKMIWKSLKG